MEAKTILQLCLRVPFPERDGGTMAMCSLAEGLKREGHRVHMLALNTSKHYVDLSSIPVEVRNDYHLQAVDVKNDLSISGALINLVNGKPYHVSRFDHQAFRKALELLLEENSYDLVVFESIFMAPYLGSVKVKKIPCFLRSHNVEYSVWERIVANTANPIKRWYLNLQKNRLKDYETRLTNQFDRVAAISQVDEDTYGRWGLAKISFTVPFGIDAQTISLDQLPKHELKIGFLGTMSWLPNLEGIKWFLQHIWPEVAQIYPQLTCAIAGYEMPASLIEKSEGNLSIQGPQSDAKSFLKDCNIIMAPLLSGGGVRIKILEAMAMGKAVMATPVGVEGIPAENRKSVMKFENATEFLEHLATINDRPKYLSSIAEGGHELIKTHFNKQKAARRLVGELDEVLR